MENLVLALLVFVSSAGVLVLQILNVVAGTGALKNLYWLSVNADPVTKHGYTHYSLVGTCLFSADSVTSTKGFTSCTNSILFSINPHSDSFWGVAGMKLAAPTWFLKHASYVHWLTRLLWPWYVVALIFNFFVLVCTPGLRFRAVRVAAVACPCAAFVFEVSASAMATAVYTQSRTAFKGAGYAALVGTKLLALAWTAVSLLALNIGLSIVSTRRQTDGDTMYPDLECEADQKHMSHTEF